ncbi:MAG: hypothetical protein GY754_46240 [bacterium]|nr:hypothetical protein [bacterium]
MRLKYRGRPLLSRAKKSSVGSAVCVLLAAGILMCTGLKEPEPVVTGSVTIRISSEDIKNIVDYTIEGTGPAGSEFRASAMNGLSTIKNLEPGRWLLSVSGNNGMGKVIARGLGEADVAIGTAAETLIPVKRLTRKGALRLKGDFNISGMTAAPVITGELRQMGKKPKHLGLKIYMDSSPGRALYFGKRIKTGYYDLVITVKENKQTVCGAMKTIRIIDGGITSVTMAIKKTEAGSSLVLAVTTNPYRQSPATIIVKGGHSKLALGQSMTLAAHHALGEDVVAAWYLDGVYKHNGFSFITETSLSPGPHRLDVSIFTIDGSKGVSASRSFKIAYTKNEGMIITSRHSDLPRVNKDYYTLAKSKFKLVYGHSPSDAELRTGLSGLSRYNNLYSWRFGARLRGDLGDPAWAEKTRAYLECHPEANVVLWFWGETTGNNSDIVLQYIEKMEYLIAAYPGVKFIFTTRHLAGKGPEGDVSAANTVIREHCAKRGRILFDVADFDAHDPSGNNFLTYNVNRDGDYVKDGIPGNLAEEWCALNPDECVKFCTPRAIQQKEGFPRKIRSVQKAKGFAWMMARLAGWNGS